jgi:hypothetical protein
MGQNRVLGAPEEIQVVDEDTETAFSTDVYLVDTSVIPITITLDPFAVEGDRCVVADGANNAAVNNVTIVGGGGNPILHSPSTKLVSNGASLTFLFSFGLGGWQIVAPASSTNAVAAMQRLEFDVPLATIKAAVSGVPFNIGAPLPANARVLGTEANVVQAVAGGSLATAVMTVQNTGEPAGALVGGGSGLDVLTGTGLFVGGGANAYASRGGQQLQMTLFSTGDTFAHATAGHVKIELFYAIVS